MKLGLGHYTWSPRWQSRLCISERVMSVDLRFTATWQVDHGSQVDKWFHLLDIMLINMKTGWLILGGAQCLNHRLLPVNFSRPSIVASSGNISRAGTRSFSSSARRDTSSAKSKSVNECYRTVVPFISLPNDLSMSQPMLVAKEST